MRCELRLERSWWSRAKRAAASPPPPYVFTEISFDALAPTAAADHVSLRPEPFRDQESLQSGPGEVPCEPHHLLFIVFLFRTFGPENCTNILFPVHWSKLYFWKFTGKRLSEYTRIIFRGGNISIEAIFFFREVQIPSSYVFFLRGCTIQFFGLIYIHPKVA